MKIADMVSKQATSVAADIMAHPILSERSTDEIGNLRFALNARPIRTEAAAVLATLIESVMIYPDGVDGTEVEVVAKMEDLMAFAKNENSRLGVGRSGSFTTVVAGTGFEPVTFRL